MRSNGIITLGIKLLLVIIVVSQCLGKSHKKHRNRGDFEKDYNQESRPTKRSRWNPHKRKGHWKTKHDDHVSHRNLYSGEAIRGRFMSLQKTDLDKQSKGRERTEEHNSQGSTISDKNRSDSKNQQNCTYINTKYKKGDTILGCGDGGDFGNDGFGDVGFGGFGGGGGEPVEVETSGFGGSGSPKRGGGSKGWNSGKIGATGSGFSGGNFNPLWGTKGSSGGGKFFTISDPKGSNFNTWGSGIYGGGAGYGWGHGSKIGGR